MITLALLVQTAILVALSLAVIYPVVAYARHVMHAEAIALLATALLVFTVSTLIEAFTGMQALAEGVHALSNVAFAAAIWLFAREFIRTESGFADSGVPDEEEDGPTGFEHVTRRRDRDR